MSFIFPLLSIFSKFWTRNRPGDKMRDRYNLNLLPGMSEDGVEYGEPQRTNGRRQVFVTSLTADLFVFVFQTTWSPTAWPPSLGWASPSS